MKTTITINNDEYDLMSSDKLSPITCALDITDNIEKGEYYQYGEYFIYKTNEGCVRACYVNDTDNNWEI